MTCQECELFLAADQSAGDHLAGCASCRALAEELRANAQAFESFAEDPLPEVRARVMSKVRPRRVRWAWALAAVAALAVVMISYPRPETPAPRDSAVASGQGQIAMAPQPAIPTHISRKIRKRAAQPLTVKMLTEDPDVVIYWQFQSEDQ